MAFWGADSGKLSELSGLSVPRLRFEPDSSHTQSWSANSYTEELGSFFKVQGKLCNAVFI
jgi:hypothetical protein